jgi:glycosyltransferase involved in cell wall biosynthesis
MTMNYRLLTALPVYNEANHVADVLREVTRHAGDLLVVDDGSSDKTEQILKAEQKKYGRAVLQTVRHARNQGYGAALKTAFQYTITHDYDVLVTIDCDGQHEPRLIPELANTVFTPEADAPYDIVSGSRYLKTFKGDSKPPLDRRRINREITQILNCRLGLDLTDSFCGFKAYRVPALSAFHITELGYAMPLQLWVQAVAAGLRITEFPVPLVYLEEERSFGGSLDDANRRMAYYEEVLDRELAAAMPEAFGCRG